MTEIIPSILVDTFEEFDEKIRTVADYVNWVHLDVSDGDFAPNKTWGDPIEIHDYDAGVFIEAHLMVSKPENVIYDWITGRSGERDSGISRIYFHYEATSAHEEIVEKIQDGGKEAGIALLAETPLSVLNSLLGKLDSVLLFGGSLGFYGGKFNERLMLSKISALRKLNKDVIIGIDGGVNPEAAKKAIKAGANSIVSGSFIWGSKDVKKAIEKLKKSVKN
jgi:ribulose-phosphate 3-epimerase